MEGDADRLPSEADLFRGLRLVGLSARHRFDEDLLRLVEWEDDVDDVDEEEEEPIVAYSRCPSVSALRFMTGVVSTTVRCG